MTISFFFIYWNISLTLRTYIFLTDLDESQKLVWNPQLKEELQAWQQKCNHSIISLNKPHCTDSVPKTCGSYRILFNCVGSQSVAKAHLTGVHIYLKHSWCTAFSDKLVVDSSVVYLTKNRTLIIAKCTRWHFQITMYISWKKCSLPSTSQTKDLYITGGRNSSLVVFGLAVHSVAGSILLWGHFPVEGIFPSELTWVQTPFPQKLFRMRV